MDVECVPLTDFVHGNLTAREGRPMQIAEHLARELEKAGLVRIRMPQAPALQLAAGSTEGKAQDDGAGRPSSASPADPASPQRTLHLPGSGANKGRKGAT